MADISAPPDLLPVGPPWDGYAGLYEKLSVFRLNAIVQRLVSDPVVPVASTGFAESWETARRLQLGALAAASRQPLFDLWVSTAERMIRSRAFFRYPNAHPARHLADFATLVASWASLAPDGAGGRVRLSGPRPVVPFLHGRLLLTSKVRRYGQSLRWRRDGGVISIDLEGVAPGARIDIADPGRSEIIADDWAFVRPDEKLGALVDVWTPDYAEGDVPAHLSSHLTELLAACASTLDTKALSLVAAVCRCVTADADAPWTAGLIRLKQTADSTALLVAACRDWIERIVAVEQLGRQPYAMDNALRSAFVRVAAARLANALLHKDLRAAAAETADWDRVAALMMKEPGGSRILEALPGFCRLERPAQKKTGDAGRPDDRVMELAELAALAPHGSGALHLRKTRQGDISSADDWWAINALADRSEADVETAYRALAGIPEPTEAESFTRSICAYMLSQFEDSYDALLRCLRFDQDVEEYWHLLAFTCRHLGRHVDFDAIIFGSRRNIADFAPICRTRSTAPSTALDEKPR
jgi:hypothetical protein